MLRVCRGIPDKRILNLPAPTERYLVSIFKKKKERKEKKNEIKKKEKWHNKKLKSIFQGILAAQLFKIRCLSLISELTILVVTCMHLLRFRTAFATFVCKISDISTRSENNFRITISIETAPVQPTQIFFFLQGYYLLLKSGQSINATYWYLDVSIKNVWAQNVKKTIWESINQKILALEIDRNLYCYACNFHQS